MATQNEGPLDITMDTTTTTTTVPVIAAGHIARFRLVKVSKAQAERGPMLKFEYDLVEPAPTADGGTIQPGQMGAKMFENIALFDKNTPAGTVPQWALERIAKRQDALLGTGDANNKKGKPARPAFGPEAVEQMIGKELVAKMKVRTGDYTGNEFDQVYFPGDIAA